MNWARMLTGEGRGGRKLTAVVNLGHANRLESQRGVCGTRDPRTPGDAESRPYVGAHGAALESGPHANNGRAARCGCSPGPDDGLRACSSATDSDGPRGIATHSPEPPLILLGPGGDFRNASPSHVPERGVVYLALGLFCIAVWAAAWSWVTGRWH